MLTTRLQDALNVQINKEMYSSYLYLSMAAYFDSISLPGFASWMRLQSQEEYGHGLKIFDYVNDRGGRVMLQSIAQPAIEFESPLAVLQQTLEHEQEVTASIYQLYELSQKEGDYPAQVMLQWFIDEQVEEEKTASEIVDHLKIIGNDGAGLLMIDDRMGRRTAEGAAEA